MRRWLPALAYDHPVSVLMLCLALLVIGVLSWSRIPLQLLPSGYESSWLHVWIPYVNATPTESDEKIVRPFTTQLGTISGIASVRSSARADGASVNIEFHGSVDMDEAYNAIGDRLERARLDMPEEVDRYFVFKSDPDDMPIMFVAAALPSDVDDPFYLLNRVVKPKIERVTGVAAVDSWGVPQRSLYIDYDRERIISHAIDVGEVQRKMGADNFQMPGGEIVERGQIRQVRSLARISDPEVFVRYPVRDQLVLEDIASVRMRNAMSASINRLNGQDAAVLIVRKEASANTVAVTQEIREVLDGLEASRQGQGVTFFPFFDQGEMVTESLDNLTNTALIGGAFAVVILFAFLREWRMTILIAAAIPFSILITVGVLYFQGSTLNALSLMGLMLAVGMVVDNAIVVVETIYRRRAEGAETRDAAVHGSAEVNLAIVMSTLTTMVVFLPLILMSEDTDSAFFAGVLGLPVVFALAASLLVALFFAPLATRFIGQGRVKEDPRWMIWMAKRYRSVLGWVLKRRVDALASLVVLAIATLLVPVRGVECTAVDENNARSFDIGIQVPPTAGYAERNAVVQTIEELLAKHVEEWGISVYYAELEDSNFGRVQVFLESDGPMTRSEVMDAARDVLPNNQAGVVFDVGWARAGSANKDKKQVSFSIEGEDMAMLEELGEEAVRRIKSMPGILAARRDVLNEGSNELRVRLRQGALERYGISGQTAASTVAYYLRGTELNPILDGEREVGVVTRFELDDRSDMNALLESPIFSMSTMGLVPLRALGDVEYGKGPRNVHRVNGQTGITITADMDEDLSRARGLETIGAALEGMTFPRGYSWLPSNRFQAEADDWWAQLMLIGMSIVFVFLLMGVLFESWLLPFSIITTVPMAVVGAFWLLWAWSSPFDTMAGIGVVILVGVVVNNGIVLIDLIRQLREEGRSREEAILEAGELRFRPILMTALTTIFGLIPMAMGSGEVVGISYAPLGQTVIGGLAAATLLTLLFVPFLYAWLDDVRLSMGTVFRTIAGTR